MELNIRNRMDAPIHTHIGYNPEELYLELETRRETTTWEGLVQRFKVMFTFEHESPSIEAALQAIRTKIFLKDKSMEEDPLDSEHTTKLTVQKLLECYNVTEEEYDEGEPMNFQRPETEGTCTVEGHNWYLSHTHN
jgi:hypothetical protein